MFIRLSPASGRDASARRIRAALAAFAVLGWMAFASAPALATSATFGGDTPTLLPQSVPNYFFTEHAKFDQMDMNPASTSRSTTVVADPVNHLLFEFNPQASPFGLTTALPSSCAQHFALPTWLLALDSDTYRLQAVGCAENRALVSGLASDEPLMAVDPVDRLLFFASGSASQTSPQSADSVVVVSETSLLPVASWTLPATTTRVAPEVFELSWSAKDDELIVLSGATETPTSTLVPPGVYVSAFGIAAATRSTAPSALYSTQVPGCSYPLLPFFASAAAYESQDLPALFVPCGLTGSSGPQTPIPGVVKLPISGGAPSTAGAATAVAPGVTSDFIFDPGADRGFMPYQSNSGTSLFTYDGRSGQFVGNAAIVGEPAGVQNPDLNCVAFSIDPGTGRVVGMGPSGMMFIDGRRTPLAPGTNIDSLARYVQYQLTPTLPPDPEYPFARVLVDSLQLPGGDACNPGTASPSLPSFDVVADTLPVTADPPPTSVDSNTYAGPIPPGAPASTVYSANGEASGAHLLWPGSYGGAVNNTTGAGFYNADSLPLASGIRDLVGGWTRQASLADGYRSAAATPLGDGTSSTATGVQSCTDLSAPSGCQPSVPDPPALPGAPQTAQAWPFQTAACPLPGASPQQAADGAYLTSGYDAANNPQQTQVPGSTGWAVAAVDCAPKSPVGGVSATAAVQGVDSGSAGAASLQVAQAWSSAVQAPGSGAAPATSTVAAAARGIRVSVGGATLSIGSVEQTATAQATGRTGGAKASRTVTLADVSVTPVGATSPRVICAAACPGDPQQVVAQVNALLPSHVALSFPQPDSPFGAAGARTSPAGVYVQTIPGSPGGYEALVQPTVGEMYGDEAFNGMPASDGETSMLPALRVTVYLDQIGPTAYGLDRVILDLAPVEADAEDGVTVSCPAGTYAPDPSQPLDCVQFSGQGGGGAGQPGIPGSPSRYVPGSAGYYLPGTAGSAGGAFVPATLTAPGGLTPRAFASVVSPSLFTAPGAWLKKVFSGFRLLARSPAAAAEFFGFICLLSAPAVLAVRRRRWQRAVSDD